MKAAIKGLRAIGHVVGLIVLNETGEAPLRYSQVRDDDGAAAQGTPTIERGRRTKRIVASCALAERVTNARWLRSLDL